MKPDENTKRMIETIMEKVQQLSPLHLRMVMSVATTLLEMQKEQAG